MDFIVGGWKEMLGKKEGENNEEIIERLDCAIEDGRLTENQARMLEERGLAEDWLERNDYDPH